MATIKPASRSTGALSDTPDHKPYVPDDAKMPEFTWPAVVVGALLGIVFGASSLYLVLKVGLTVSASIPVAVMSITLFRLFARIFGMRPTTILENNIVQTAGSAGESIAFGVGVTMPALMILGFEMDIGRVMTVAVLGGLLGIFMMIPLRRAFIVKQHGKLKYPEGTACAEVLMVGDKAGLTAAPVFVGFGVSFVYMFLQRGMKLWQETASHALKWYRGAVAEIDLDPVLLGVGYIIGTRVACVMAAGGVLAGFVLAPLIHLVGERFNVPAIAGLSEDDLRREFILYIGAGAVTAGGIISLVQALPLIISSIRAVAGDLRGGGASADGKSSRRTDRDLPLWLVGIGGAVLVAALWATSWLHKSVPWIPQLEINLLGAAMVVLFGFLFVTVSSRLTGEIGSSSNPISGMTVATLLLTCIVFLLWHKASYASDPELRNTDLLAAISVAGVVCVAASNGGTTSQDLKTGYLIGATPYRQQWAILIGAFASSLAIGGILILINNAGTVYSKDPHNVPRLTRPLDVAKLTEWEKSPDGTMYRVWRPQEGNDRQVPPGKYLVGDNGQPVWLVDPGINGRLDKTDEGAQVQKFKSPKARLMALVAQGILGQTLPWTLLLVGVSIAVVLELCGVPSLAFAVGVYLPLGASMPIFVGGVIRYLSDRWAKGAADRTEAQRDSGSGVLMSTGYIAGGALGMVLVAFLSFNAEIPKALGRWQTPTLPPGRTFDEQINRLAADQLGIPYEVPAKDGETNAQRENREKRIFARAHELVERYRFDLAQFSVIRAGTPVKIPGKTQPYVPPRDESLGTIAANQLGDIADVKRIVEVNDKDWLPEPPALPAGTPLQTPSEWPGLVIFAVLVALLLAVGLGWLMPGGADVKAPKPKTPSEPEGSGRMPDRKAPLKQP